MEKTTNIRKVTGSWKVERMVTLQRLLTLHNGKIKCETCKKNEIRFVHLWMKRLEETPYLILFIFIQLIFLCLLLPWLVIFVSFCHIRGASFPSLFSRIVILLLICYIRHICEGLFPCSSSRIVILVALAFPICYFRQYLTIVAVLLFCFIVIYLFEQA